MLNQNFQAHKAASPLRVAKLNIHLGLCIEEKTSLEEMTLESSKVRDWFSPPETVFSPSP